LSVESLSQNLPDGTAKVINALYLDELGKTGSPRITNTDVNVTVDINTKVLIKMKINAPTGFTIYSGKLKFSWLYGNGTFDNWVSVDIKNSEDFVLYELSPSWYGNVKQVAVELEGLPEQDKRPLNAYIDYIQFVNTDSFFNINLFPSNVRIITEDKDVKVYLGNQTYPVINMKNFIVADTYKTSVTDYDAPKIKIGKLSPENDLSLFGYTRLRFIAGGSYAPTSKKILELRNTTKFPSARLNPALPRSRPVTLTTLPATRSWLAENVTVITLLVELVVLKSVVIAVVVKSTPGSSYADG
jgi:hypothetical protein